MELTQPHSGARAPLLPEKRALAGLSVPKAKNTFLREPPTADDKQAQVLFPDYTSPFLPPDTLVEKHIVGPHGKAQEGIPM